MDADKLVVVQKLCKVINTEWNFGTISRSEYFALTNAVKRILKYEREST